MDVLVVLLERAGEVVSFDELLDTVWAGRVVEEATVYQRISKLRQAFDDDAHDPRYIENVPRRGYRAKAAVAVDENQPTTSWHRPTMRSLAALALVAALAVAAFVVTQRKPAADPPEPTGITVLPFVNLSSDPSQDFFGEGIAEDILSGLAKASSLKVISRTSSFGFKGTDPDVHRIREALDVSHVVLGSVRRERDKIRVAAKLIAAVPTAARSGRIDTTLTSRTCSRCRTRSPLRCSALSTFISSRASSVPTANPAAYTAFLEGRWHGSEGRHDEALAAYGRAIALDPGYADAHATIAMTHIGNIWTNRATVAQTLRAMDQDKHLERALAIDPSHPVARACAATLRFFVERDFQGGIDAYDAILREHPNDTFTLLTYAFLLRSVDAIDATIRVTRRARTLDPLNPILITRFIDDLVYAGFYEEARSLIAKTQSSGFPAVLRRPQFHANLLAQMAYDEGDRDAVLAQLDHVDPEMRHIWQARLALDDRDDAALQRHVAALAPLADTPFIRGQIAILTGNYEPVLDNLDAAIVDRWWAISWAFACPCRPNQPRGGWYWLAKHKHPELYNDPRYQRILAANGIDKASILEVRVPDLPF